VLTPQKAGQLYNSGVILVCGHVATQFRGANNLRENSLMYNLHNFIRRNVIEISECKHRKPEVFDSSEVIIFWLWISEYCFQWFRYDIQSYIRS